MSRMEPADRLTNLLDSAVFVAEKWGYQNITRSQIAEHAGVAPGLVSHYLGTMDEVRTQILSHAIQMKCIQVIAQGLAAGHPAAKTAPLKLKKQAAHFLIKG